MAMPSAAPEQTRPAGFAAISRAVVSAAADLVGTVERAVVGDANVRTARGNAWDALCADRARAQARDEMDQLVRALLANGPRTRAAEVSTAAELSRAANASAANASAANASAAGADAAAVGAPSAARGESRAERAASASSRTRPATPKRHNGQNQPATGRRSGQNQSAAARRTARGQRAVGSSPRSSASQAALASTGSSSR
jgi:hypothetical protein